MGRPRSRARRARRRLLTLAQERGLAVRELSAGDGLPSFWPTEITVLGPPAHHTFTGNDASLVLRIALGDVSFLFPGDVEAAAEEALLTRSLGPATVLKVPHHGSTTSSTTPFVRLVSPRHVVYCVGRKNRHGFPHKAVVARYQEEGCTLHRTDRDGAITFVTDGTSLEVRHHSE